MKYKIVVLLLLIINTITVFIPHNSMFTLILNIMLFILYLLFPQKVTETQLEVEIDVNEEIIEKNNDPLKEVYTDPREANRPVTCHSCTDQIYYIQKSIPIIKKLINNTQKNEEVIVQELFKQFERISDDSDIIAEESDRSMKTIFDQNEQHNLTYVMNASKEISKEFLLFLNMINQMNKITDNFVNSSIESFNSISNMTKDIIELAEQVQVISINVRIEAARVRDSGGFKVLANDISIFSDKTSRVALSTNEKIKETISKIKSQREDLFNQLEFVETTAKKIYSKVTPFEKILNVTSESIISSINNFNNVSSSLQQNLRRSITHLQYQDIASQEINHILQLLEKIDECALMDRDYSLYMSKEKKKEIKHDILNFLKEISATVNEEDEIKLLSEKWGIEIIEETKASATEINEGIFLF